MTVRRVSADCLTMFAAMGGMVVAGLALADGPVVYRLHATSDVTLTLPVPAGHGKILVLDAQQTWRAIPHEVTEKGIRLAIKADELAEGRTMLAYNVPARVDMTDRAPPQVVGVSVDGTEKEARTRVDLGGVAELPKELVVRIRDEKNALVPASLRVTANGVPIAVGKGSTAARYASQGEREAVVTVPLGTLREALGGKSTVAVSLDDEALDESELRFELLFAWVKPHTLSDGSILAVDSVTSSGRWAEWWVVSDDVIMDEGYGTTAGYTWLSEQTDTPHWLSVTFPTPRAISKVALYWAHYQCYRTSRAYSVQIWDGAQWVTQATVDGQKETQCSTHTFAPVTTTCVRVWQPADSGQVGRAGYMWLSEFDGE